ncbi:hypothetical protein [Tistrella mobilis]|uniref:hypothetical protein n=1 Tax=Tistrella mobilis TaxID=171437 RepID=UPI0012E9696D|nr:hypothetical protein [Tistrella mobilis]
MIAPMTAKILDRISGGAGRRWECLASIHSRKFRQTKAGRRAPARPACKMVGHHAERAGPKTRPFCFIDPEGW